MLTLVILFATTLHTITINIITVIYIFETKIKCFNYILLHDWKLIVVKKNVWIFTYTHI